MTDAVRAQDFESDSTIAESAAKNASSPQRPVAAKEVENPSEQLRTTGGDGEDFGDSKALAAPKDSASSTALSTRMARFKALQQQRTSGRKDTEREVIEERRRAEGKDQNLAKARHAHDQAEYKLLKSEDPDFERKRAWDYTAEEDEKWGKRVQKKARHKDNNIFSDYQGEANKVYKRQIKQMSKVDLEAYAAEKAEVLQRQVTSGLLELVETDSGDVFTIDKLGRVNTPADENYNCDHKPSKEAVDRLVDDLEKGERARLKARAARGIRDNDDSGDVTYINQKNKQFNDKLARFYNRYTSEIRDSFERGTAI